MERKELVNTIKDTLKATTQALVTAMNELHLSMNERIAVIAGIRKELAEDNAALGEISVAVLDFAGDMEDISENMESIVMGVDNILYDLDNIPDEIILEKEEEDAPDGWVECDDEDFDEEETIDEIAE